MIDVQTSKLDVFLGNTQILHDIDIHVANKEFVGIIGPNGSGKSTLLKTIYRVLKPKAGTVLINDMEIQNISVKNTSKMLSVVSQQNDAQFDMTVLEMVLIGRSPYKKFMERDNKEDYDIVYEALEQVGMTDYANRSFLSLSGGEKQRTILARALAQKTECLILDEPTNHLDIKHQLQIMGITKNLGITVISAIHDLNIAAMYCDKLYALQKGRVFAYGTPKEVLTTEKIKELYDVEAEVTENPKTGVLNISFTGNL